MLSTCSLPCARGALLSCLGCQMKQTLTEVVAGQLSFESLCALCLTLHYMKVQRYCSFTMCNANKRVTVAENLRFSSLLNCLISFFA